ncbi:cytochrome P450 [Dichomitus squalens LYAD-421 SS1]|uniref:Cytochrome P450 n=1 Tax=Dichomitus squalens (strain LYAD-421) TaxID=732165 RepID=R7SWU7_DICSQ|nr:cytochrome P450 [Dichomitus squalens LYAD-421 SS1]EJF60561.1 cytochrome P450 [Dichomitus squalens LYAD-421 SS1]
MAGLLNDTFNSTPVLVILVLVIVWRLSAAFRRKSVLESLPVPSGAEFVWGHEKQVFMNEPGQAYRKWKSELGLTYRIKAAFGAPDILVLSDPVSIAYILQKKIYDYHHSRVVRPRVARLLGKGLGWVEGEAEHKRMRRLVSPSLSPENVKSMSSDVRVAALEVVDQFVSHVQSGAEKPVNILDWTSKATLNVIGRVAFLHDFQAGNSPEAKQILGGRRRSVSRAAKYAGFLTLMLLRRFPILNDLPIAAIQSQGLAKVAIQTGVARELIRRNQDIVKNGDTKASKDLLSRLLVAHAAGDISEEELYEQISTFIVSGHETTTQTLGFTIYELSRHPEIQAKLREELAAVKGEPTYDDFQARLPYLEAVLRETLRLYPGLPYIERVATVPDSIPLGEPVKLSNGEVVSQIPVLPGQVVVIPCIAIHRMDSVWEDPDVFRPERWLKDLPASEKLCSGWANTLAFSDGPRNCVGYRLAIFQYKVILTYLLERLKFGDAGMDITLKIASSLQAWVKDRPELGGCLPVNVDLL